MKTGSKVSVIMAVRDAADTIAATIDSVRNQSFDGFEFIIVDDGSTDGTGDIVAAIKDRRLRLLRQENAGPSAARNSAVECASGTFISCIDGDDVWSPHKLERQLRAFEENPDAGVVYGWADFVDEDDRYICADPRPTHQGHVYEALLRRNFISSGSNAMYRRDLFCAVGGFDCDLRAVEDWELHVRLAKVARFTQVSDVLVRYRQRPNSLSGNLALMEQAFDLASEKIFGDAPPALNYLRARCRASFYFYLAVRATQTGHGPRRWLQASRLAALALRHEPVHVLALAAKGAPIASMRLAFSERRS